MPNRGACSGVDWVVIYYNAESCIQNCLEIIFVESLFEAIKTDLLIFEHKVFADLLEACIKISLFPIIPLEVRQ